MSQKETPEAKRAWHKPTIRSLAARASAGDATQNNRQPTEGPKGAESNEGKKLMNAVAAPS